MEFHGHSNRIPPDPEYTAYIRRLSMPMQRICKNTPLCGSGDAVPEASRQNMDEASGGCPVVAIDKI
jgi:hypothetical protein